MVLASQVQADPSVNMLVGRLLFLEEQAVMMRQIQDSLIAFAWNLIYGRRLLNVDDALPALGDVIVGSLEVLSLASWES